MTIIELLLKINNKLKNASLQNTNKDAAMIVSKALNSTKEYLIINQDNSVKFSEIRQCIKMVKMRINHYSISKIIGYKEFWGHEIMVNKNTLDPRPDSETIVDALIKHWPNKNKSLTILDLGTGTGCLAIAVAKEYKRSKGFALDINHKSLMLARQNLKKHNLLNRFKPLKTSWNSYASITKKKFDVIISNPPYIKSRAINNLANEVKLGEPLIALNGGCNGLHSILSIFKILKIIMKENGVFICEIGFMQEKELVLLYKKYGLTAKRHHHDLSGKIRCITFTLTKPNQINQC
ncbi:peptide chain release factor N(5)-glutamine methyltransferase [Candidatus Xenohaliotis californiensis]|uniref:peptide chain release factor N(5)-glutamine methyltransferase n=1 Tax=Candidatus Xenohaliotis californiensis TaxID=84677 RepID=A0ABM9N7L2_9RICK|nr:peptide chain release factor N(5)-glutamine methyltransferase [Candidatus Xenohaliotis californiensis]